MNALIMLAAASGSLPTAAAGKAATTPAMPGLAGTAFALVLVVGLIIGLGWIVRRMPGTALRPMEGLRVVTSLPIGQRERAVVVEVDGTQLLLGVTAHSINVLHKLDKPLGAAAAGKTPTLPSFADLLTRIKKAA